MRRPKLREIRALGKEGMEQRRELLRCTGQFSFPCPSLSLSQTRQNAQNGETNRKACRAKALIGLVRAERMLQRLS